MAGEDPLGIFSADEFRTNIRQTMLMGMPDDDDEKLKWHFAPIKSYAPDDPALQPYDWKTQPTSEIPGNPSLPEGWIIVDYAQEFSAQVQNASTEVGKFDTSRLVITVLDVDYEKIKNADYAMIRNVHYDINFVGPPLGLFTVTVYQFYLQARDQA